MGIRLIADKVKTCVVSAMLNHGLYQPLWWATLKGVREEKSSSTRSVNQAPHLLALNFIRFRGELQMLSVNGEIRMSVIEQNHQCRFQKYFYNKVPTIYELGQSNPNIPGQKEYQEFLMGFLSRLSKRRNITGVVTAHFSYVSDYDWGVAAEKVGLRWFVLLKGGLVAAPRFREELLERFRRQGCFPGSLIITHNKEIADVIVEAKLASEEKVAVLGAGRFDHYISQARRHSLDKLTPDRRPKLLLCSFPHAAGLTGVGMNSEFFQERFEGVWSKGRYGFVELFERTHAAAAFIARKHPDYDVVIKTKWAGNWIETIHEALEKFGLDASKIPNLTITADGNMQDLIFTSRVVCSFGSTTILEAAIANVPVVVPFFAEAVAHEYKDYVLFGSLNGVFEKALSPEALEKTLLDYLSGASRYVPNEAAITHAYERFIGPVTGKSLDKIKAAIIQMSSPIQPVV